MGLKPSAGLARVGKPFVRSAQGGRIRAGMPPAQGAAAKGGGQQKPSEEYVAELLRRLQDEETRHQREKEEMVREHRRTITEMKSKFTERNNDLVREQDKLKTEKKHAVQMATAAAHEIRRLTFLLKLSKGKHEKVAEGSQSQGKVALPLDSASEGSSSSAPADDRDGGEAQESEETALEEDDKENHIVFISPKAPSGKKVIKLRLKMRRPLQPTSLDTIPEDELHNPGGEHDMEMDSIEASQESDGDENSDMSVTARGSSPEGESKGHGEMSSISMMNLSHVLRASANFDDLRNSQHEQALDTPVLSGKEPFTRAEGDCKHSAKEMATGHVTTRRGAANKNVEGSSLLSKGAKREETRAPPVQEEDEQCGGLKRRGCSELFGQSAGRESREERQRKRSRQDNFMVSKCEEAAEDAGTAEDGLACSHAHLGMESARFHQGYGGEEVLPDDEVDDSMLTQEEDVPVEEVRPRRRLSGVSYAEPSLSQKLRQGDAHTFNSGYDTGIKTMTLAQSRKVNKQRRSSTSESQADS